MTARLSQRVPGCTESVIREIRFCFPRTDDVLREAGERLQKLRGL